jgi:hypothetical protein
MTYHFLDIPLTVIGDEEWRPADPQLYEHLKYAWTLPNPYPLPMIHVGEVGEKIVVQRGHKYVRVARELGHARIRGVFESELKDTAEVLKGLPQGIRMIPRDVLEREEAEDRVRGYQVFFFERPLTSQEQGRFLTDIVGYFERSETSLIASSEKRVFQYSFPFGGRCAQVEAIMPVGDHSWIAGFGGACIKFSREVVRIVSLRGEPFIG